MLNARPRLPNEPLEVYVADLTRLTSLAFPHFAQKSREDEVFRRFLVGLSPEMQRKCHEHGAQTLADALRIAHQVERADEALRLPFTRSDPQPPVVAAATAAPLPDALTEVVKSLSQLHVQMSELANSVTRLSQDRQRNAAPRHHSPSPYSRSHSPSPYSRSYSPSQYHRSDQTPGPPQSSSATRGGTFNSSRRSRSPSPFSPRDSRSQFHREYRSPGRDSRYQGSDQQYSHHEHVSRRDNGPARSVSSHSPARSHAYRAPNSSSRRVSFAEGQHNSGNGTFGSMFPPSENPY